MVLRHQIHEKVLVFGPNFTILMITQNGFGMTIWNVMFVCLHNVRLGGFKLFKLETRAIRRADRIVLNRFTPPLEVKRHLAAADDFV
jgi:hypothetical protein